MHNAIYQMVLCVGQSINFTTLEKEHLVKTI